jgi:hypothetical protein
MKDNVKFLTAKEKAQLLVMQNKMVLMEEDTECGNEVLCSTIAKKIALLNTQGQIDYWTEVKQEIENL